MPDTNVRRRADVLRAESRDVLRVLHPEPCPGCVTQPPKPPLVLVPCLRCRGWRA